MYSNQFLNICLETNILLWTLEIIAKNDKLILNEYFDNHNFCTASNNYL